MGVRRDRLAATGVTPKLAPWIRFHLVALFCKTLQMLSPENQVSSSAFRVATRRPAVEAAPRRRATQRARADRRAGAGSVPCDRVCAVAPEGTGPPRDGNHKQFSLFVAQRQRHLSHLLRDFYSASTVTSTKGHELQTPSSLVPNLFFGFAEPSTGLAMGQRPTRADGWRAASVCRSRRWCRPPSVASTSRWHGRHC